MSDAGTIGTNHSAPTPLLTTTPQHSGAALDHSSPSRGLNSYTAPCTATASMVTVSGTVKIGSVPVARTVRAYRRRDGFLIGEATSSAEDGAFTIDCLGFTGPVTVIALDESEAGEDYNAQIFDLITPA